MEVCFSLGRVKCPRSGECYIAMCTTGDDKGGVETHEEPWAPRQSPRSRSPAPSLTGHS